MSLFDRPGLEQAIAGHDAVVNLATSIPPVSRTLSRKAWVANNRVRTEGSRTLVDAALPAGARRYIQESITFLYPDGRASWIDETFPVEVTPVTASAVDAETNAGLFTAAGGVGIVLRFGAFYGPDSDHTAASSAWPGWRWTSCPERTRAGANLASAWDPLGFPTEPIRYHFKAVLASGVGWAQDAGRVSARYPPYTCRLVGDARRFPVSTAPLERQWSP